MERFNFPVVLEPDGDTWFACLPEYEHLGVATWGKSREEAAKNLVEVAIMTFQDLGRDATE
jgi:predicted RNase H-like HicB family nuclease